MKLFNGHLKKNYCRIFESFSFGCFKKWPVLMLTSTALYQPHSHCTGKCWNFASIFMPWDPVSFHSLISSTQSLQWNSQYNNCILSFWRRVDRFVYHHRVRSAAWYLPAMQISPFYPESWMNVNFAWFETVIPEFLYNCGKSNAARAPGCKCFVVFLIPTTYL